MCAARSTQTGPTYFFLFSSDGLDMQSRFPTRLEDKVQWWAWVELGLNPGPLLHETPADECQGVNTLDTHTTIEWLNGKVIKRAFSPQFRWLFDSSIEGWLVRKGFPNHILTAVKRWQRDKQINLSAFVGIGSVRRKGSKQNILLDC